jgi:hypothetical protein
MVNKMTPRDLLRNAIREREKWRQNVEKATTALDRGNALLRDAETRLTQLLDVDDAIAAHHAEKVKIWAGTGGQKPSGDIPKNLLARRKARDETREEISAAKVACTALSAELDATKAVLAEAERAANEAAAGVMLEEAERGAAYLDAARREVWRLETQLRSLGELWLPTGQDQAPRPVRLPPKVHAALNAQAPQFPPLQRPEIRKAAAWRSFHTALLHDPEKTWGDECSSPFGSGALRDP